MTGRKRFSISLAGAIAGVVLLFGMTAGQTSAVDEVVAVGSATVALGSEASVDASALNVAGEGLGAWSVDVEYDSAIIFALSCDAEQGGVCNPNFADGVVRFTGASAAGLLGDTKLATITFACLTEGVSDLTVVVLELADATIGAPQPLTPSVQNGRFVCVAVSSTPPTDSDTSDVLGESLPDAGTGPGGLATGTVQIWLIAGLIGAGIAWLSTGIAGAGLAFVTGPNRPSQGGQARQRPPAPRAGGWFVLTTTPVNAPATGVGRPRRRVLNWLIAAREELANGKFDAAPSADLRRRR